MIVDDGEQRSEVGDRLVLRYVVVDAQAAAHVHEAERETQSLEVADDHIDLAAHVLEDMQFADLRTDVEMDADDVHMGQGLDPRGVLEHLLVRNAELAVGLSRVDAVVRAGVDVRVDTQCDVGHGARLRRERIHDLQLLDRLAVDRQNTLRDGVAQLLVTLAHAGVNDSPGIETRLDGLAQLVARSAVDAQPVFADDRQQVIVVIGLDGVVDLVAVFVRFVNDAFEGLAQQRRVVEIERGLEAPELGCDVPA